MTPSLAQSRTPVKRLTGRLCEFFIIGPWFALTTAAESKFMERILVGIDASHTFWEALDRALCLGPRIQARVSVLVVFPPSEGQGGEAGQAILRRVEAEIAAAATTGATVELFVTEGRFDQAMVSAAGQLKTTLLVAAATGRDEQGGERETENLGRILAGVDCRVELVSPKRRLEPKKDGL